MRIEFNKPQREPTFQFTLDALKLSPYYPAFLITTEKTPPTTDRSKAIYLLSKAALLEDARLKKVFNRAERNSFSSSKWLSATPGVLDVPKDQSENENEYWGESIDDTNDDDDNDDDGGDNDIDDERTESVSHLAIEETLGVTSWVPSQHNGVNNRETLHEYKTHDVS
nr:hypothetical protein [Tanacetum cinerariifolium]